MNSSKQILLKSCKNNNFNISDTQQHLLENYVSRLLSYNKKVNLISRVDEENIWTKHILHCTSLLFHRKFPPGANILDLGTGGGLPGIVFAIFHSELQFTLLDAIRKKIDAITSMAGELGLNNVTTVWGRAEEIGKHPDYSREFDIVVARAVAPLEKLVKWAKPLINQEIRINGESPNLIPYQSLVAFKGGDIVDEIDNARKINTVKKIDTIYLDRREDKKVVIVYIRN